MNVIQPSDILSLAQVRNKTDGENLIKVIFGILCHLKPGDTIVCGDSSFSKVDSNTLYVDTLVDSEEVIETLQEKNIIHIPI